MKTLTKFIVVLLFVLSIVQLNAQTVSVNQISVNNQNMVTNCGTIDLGTNQNNQLNIMFTITNSAGGSGYARVMLKYASSDLGYPIGNQIDIPSSSWDNTTQISQTFYNVDIQASQVQLNGSTLFVQYTKDASPNDPFKSCEFPIIKTQLPTFNISPTTQSIPCGSTSNYTFTVNNVYNTPNVTYNWSYSGWTLVSSTANSKTLTPASATTLPSHVVVTPYVNGVIQPSKTCVVSRASFTSNAVISGNTQICPGGNGIYTINNLETGNTVTWSSSNTAVATVSGATQSQVTVNGVSQGTINLIAKLTNPCGQTIDKSFRIIVGSPISNIIGFPHNGMTFGVNNYVTFSVNSNFNYSQIQWVVNGGTIIEGQNTNTITVLTNPSANTILTVSVRIYTNCGWGNYFTRNGTLINGTSPISKIYPNPSNDNIHLSELSKADYNSNTIIEIFDIFGKSVIKTKIEDSKNGISIRDLKTGIYFVKIYSTKEIETYNFVKN